MKKLFFALTIFLVLITSCAPVKKPLAQDILGTWKNSDGYSIEFRSGGNGFIPGVPGKIPDSDFDYTVEDESHVQIDVQGQQQTIGITISGDQMTWKDDLGEVAYTRVK